MNRELPLTQQRVLFASSEIASLNGFSEQAEFITTLTTTLSAMGHDVRLIVPAYSWLLSQTDPVIQRSRIRLPGDNREAYILQGQAAQNIPLYLVDIPGQFDRPGNGEPEDAIRFGLFSRIVSLMAINQAGINWQPDLLHCSGWQTALAISLLRGAWNRPATIYSMHEAKHQYCHTEQINALSIPVELLKSGALEMQGRFSFEKGAILMADQLILPSLGYRQELLNDHISHPLAPLLKKRADRLTGIPSGIDYERWSPTTDPHIEQHFDSSSFELKRLNRQRLQSELNLSLDEHDLLIGYLASGHDTSEPEQLTCLLQSIAPDTPIHILAAAGENNPALQPLLDHAERFPQRLSVHCATSESGWHRILAGSDCLLMPARHYPSAHQAQCALSYGTVPIAHASTSIQETVTDATPANLLHGRASGFLYYQATPEQLADAITRASTLRAKPAIWWQKLALQGMAQSFHAIQTTTRYLQCYQSAIDNPVATAVH